MTYSSKQIGELIAKTRKSQQLTQQELAMVVNTGVRFISDLENGKPTVQLEKTLKVLQTLGIKISLHAPSAGEHDE